MPECFLLKERVCASHAGMELGGIGRGRLKQTLVQCVEPVSWTRGYDLSQNHA